MSTPLMKLLFGHSITSFSRQAIVLAVYSLLSVTLAYSQTNITDGYSVPVMRASNLLSLPFGTRSIGMGSAQTGRADDLSAMSFNPAGLSLMGYWEWALLHQDYQNDVDGNFLTFTTPLPYGNLGIQGGIYTVRNNDIVTNGVHSHPDRNKSAYQVGLSYAAPVYQRYVHLGMQVKYFGADFSSGTGAGTAYPAKQSGIFLDFGLIGTYDLSDLKGLFFYLPKVSGGFAVRNLHPRFKLANEVSDDHIPEYNMGISLYYSHRMMLNFDVVNRLDRPTVFRTGVEFWPVYFLALRTGVGFGGSSSPYRSIHWGVGIGNSIGKSKVILEYSGFEERAAGWTANRETYHSFSLNQSFDRIVEYKTAAGREKKLAIAKSDRYNSAFKFSGEVDPGHLVDDVIANLRSFSGSDSGSPSVRAAGVRSSGGGGFLRRGVAVYPMPVEFISGEPENVPYARDIRLNLLSYLQSSPTMTSIPGGQLKGAGQRGSREPEAYLENLALQKGADLIVMGKVLVDERNEKIIVKLMYYARGSGKVYYGDREGFIRNLPEFYGQVIEEMKLQAGSLLNLEAL